ncbi:hypothetical protein BD410DRAFT_259141 [Rickenella mellea]|uniref:Uncharacterized protein n=1 Tax=Rickenella mellea TaxID=50990 RepID=A0A4Y7Q597_9AGAM|nr:hypothetical protein BD410DRAFT_259141 [Rickenella mellea]
MARAGYFYPVQRRRSVRFIAICRPFHLVSLFPGIGIVELPIFYASVPYIKQRYTDEDVKRTRGRPNRTDRSRLCEFDGPPLRAFINRT